MHWEFGRHCGLEGSEEGAGTRLCLGNREGLGAELATDAVKELVVLLKELEFCPAGGHVSEVLNLEEPPQSRESVVKMQIPETHPRLANNSVPPLQCNG